jgi:hypothetical protein
MDVFTIGLITLFSFAAVFYIVLFSFIYYWHLTKVTYIVVPAIFIFEFLISAFLIVAIVSIILTYLPELVKTAGL